MGTCTSTSRRAAVFSRRSRGPDGVRVPPKSLLQARDATCGAAVRGVWPDCAGRDARVQSVRIRQYATFTLFSGSMTAGEITARLMVEPDKIRTRGSRQAAPP